MVDLIGFVKFPLSKCSQSNYVLPRALSPRPSRLRGIGGSGDENVNDVAKRTFGQRSTKIWNKCT